MDPLYNPQGSRPIQTVRVMSNEPYPNQQFKFLHDLDDPIWYRFGSNMDPDPKGRSRTVANTSNTHCSIFWHLLEKVDNASPAGRHSWIWRIWLSGVQLKYNTGKEGIRPWKVLSRSLSSLSFYCTQMLRASGMIPWLVFVYSSWQWSPRHSTEVGLWNGWR
jgi:hypothetical protein